MIHVVHLGYNKLLLWELQAAQSQLSTSVSCYGQLMHDCMQVTDSLQND